MAVSSPQVQGTVPIVLTSRGDTAQTKLNSILLALAYLARSHAHTPSEPGLTKAPQRDTELTKVQ